MEENKKAYLNVEPICVGHFSHERFVKIKDSLGNERIGLFQRDWMKDESKLIVDILMQKGDNVLLGVPNGGEYGIYDETQTPMRQVTVKSKDLTYD